LKEASTLSTLAGGFLVAMGVIPGFGINYAFLLEWIGSFLVFASISHRLSPKFALTLSFSALIIGSIGDFIFIKTPNPLGWVLTNYMVFIHGLAGTLAGKIMGKKVSEV